MSAKGPTSVSVAVCAFCGLAAGNINCSFCGNQNSPGVPVSIHGMGDDAGKAGTPLEAAPGDAATVLSGSGDCALPDVSSISGGPGDCGRRGVTRRADHPGELPEHLKEVLRDSTMEEPTADAIAYWPDIEMWEAWPRVFKSHDEAVTEGEAARLRRISSLERDFERDVLRARTAVISVTRYDPGEEPADD